MNKVIFISLFLFLAALFACKNDTKNEARQSPEVLAKEKLMDLSETPLEDFLFMLGKWEGEFDFRKSMKNDKTDKLPAICTIKQDNHKIRLNFIYTTDDGREVADNQEVFHNVARGIYFGGNFNAVESVKKQDGITKIELSRVGSENRKPADIKTTIVFDGKQLKITKMLKPEGKSEFSYRNGYTLNKID